MEVAAALGVDGVLFSESSSRSARPSLEEILQVRSMAEASLPRVEARESVEVLQSKNRAKHFFGILLLLLSDPAA